MPSFYNPITNFRVPIDYFTSHPKFRPFYEPWTSDKLEVLDDQDNVISRAILNESTGSVHIPESE